MSEVIYQLGTQEKEKLMSTNYSSIYEQERKRKAEERRNGPRECPTCGTPINEHLNEWDRIRTNCGADKRRKAASRANLAERKRQARTDARQRVLIYCEQHLDQEQKRAVMEMCDVLMAVNYDEGHQIAEQVIHVIEAKRCKHDRIAVLEQNAAIWKRKAQASEQQLKARIEELEAELALFGGLEATIHGIATRQLQQQPDPEELPSMLPSATTSEQRDSARTLVVPNETPRQLDDDSQDEEDDMELRDE